MELGSVIVWEIGELVIIVLDVVENWGVCIVIIDVFFIVYMLDMLEMFYLLKIFGSKLVGEGLYIYCIGGVSCLAGDYKQVYYFDCFFELGDCLVFWDMIYYIMVKIIIFNGVRYFDICIWKENGELEVVRCFGYEDFKGWLF